MTVEQVKNMFTRKRNPPIEKIDSSKGLYVLKYDYGQIDLDKLTDIYNYYQERLDKPLIALPTATAIANEDLEDIIKYRDSINKIIDDLQQNFYRLFN